MKRFIAEGEEDAWGIRYRWMFPHCKRPAPRDQYILPDVNGSHYIFRIIGALGTLLLEGSKQMMLKTTETAIAAGVSVREVNRAVDEGILGGSFASGAHRCFSAADCLAIRFYFSMAGRLTVRERLCVIEHIRGRLQQAHGQEPQDIQSGDWVVRDEFLAIDLTPFRLATAERLNRLAAARAVVSSSPEVLAGTPVILGTRVPVYDVAASRAAGHSVAALLAGYPSLTAEHIELASLYAEANPVRGRPRILQPPHGATLVAERTMVRRQQAA